ncbi:MAG TPA: hypothetical protein VEC06_14395, partial [Paucimonas sp.]|nr:hypothetical protein [Paucimonas sp.]
RCAPPSSAHTYRLLLVKELFHRNTAPSHRIARQQIVLFVSSRETRLCRLFRLASSVFLFRFSHSPHLQLVAFRLRKLPSNRFVRQQQRNEIMVFFGDTVNTFF